MGQTADEVRREIERTRYDMTQTVDAIGDRVSPRRIMERRTDRLRSGLRSMRETVMGTTEDMVGSIGQGASSIGHGASEMGTAAGHELASVASSAIDTVREAPERAKRQTRGNPFAAGLVAFGGGLLLASILPKNEAEAQAASKLLPHLDPVKDQLRAAGEELKVDLTEAATEKADMVREHATVAAEQVKQEVGAAAAEVKDQSAGAAQVVAGQARSAAETVRSEVKPS